MALEHDWELILKNFFHFVEHAQIDPVMQLEGQKNLIGCQMIVLLLHVVQKQCALAQKTEEGLAFLILESGSFVFKAQPN